MHAALAPRPSISSRPAAALPAVTVRNKDDPVRQQLIRALFSDTSSNGGETLLMHVKIYEEEKPSKDSKATKKGGAADRTRLLSKPRYLCMTVKGNGKIRLHKVKKTSATSFHIGRTWHLDEIKTIENMDARRVTVIINRPYCWVTDTQEIKNEFLAMLVKVLRANLKRLPHLVNMDEPALVAQFAIQTKEQQPAPATRNRRAAPTPSAAGQSGAPGGMPMNEDRLTITTDPARNRRPPTLNSTMTGGSPRSERGSKFNEDIELDEVALMNLEELLYDMDLASAEDGVALETRLMNELSALELANIYDIIESDDKIKDVMEELDKGIEELDDMDSWLFLYRQELDSMGDDIRQIESQNRGLQVQTSNQASLLRELENLLTAITINDRVLEVLKRETLEHQVGIKRLEEASAVIQDVLIMKYDDGVANMAAVQGRMDLYNNHCNIFAARFADFLKGAIEGQADKLLNDRTRALSKGYVVMFGYDSVEKFFIQYRGLLLWLREMDARRFTDSQMLFVNSINRLYRKELKEFFNVLNTNHVAKLEKPEDSEFVFGSAYSVSLISRGGTALRGSLSSPSELSAKIPWRKRSTREIQTPVDLRGAGGGNGHLSESSRKLALANAEEKLAIDEAFSQTLTLLLAHAARGQNYLVEVFSMTRMMSLQMYIDENPELMDLESRQKPIMDVKSAKRLTQLMGTMVDGLSAELNAFVDNGVKNESVQCVGMLISVERTRMEYQDSDQVFINTVLVQLQTKLVGLFEKYVEEQLKFIEESRQKTKRKGVLPYMRTFPRFAERMELLLDGNETTEARGLITSAYDKLVRVMFESTEAIAKETVDFDDKEQGSHIVNMENMHHFYSELRARRVRHMESYMKYAKSSYESHLDIYVRSVVRKSLSKLLDFFDGVEGLVKTKASEDVGFHLSYNKAALKKVVGAYPASTIRKEIASVYKKVEKHLSEEEGLLQVAWRGIHEEFIRQHERFVRLIQTCYPDMGVQLEFTLQDLQRQ